MRAGSTSSSATARCPTVWIPPRELRDQRDLPRTRMVLVRQRTQLKNRIHATLAKYALHDLEVSDLFGARGRALLRQRLELLPPHTAYATQQLLEEIENLDRRVDGFEQRMQTVFKVTPGDRPAADAARRRLHPRRRHPLEVGDVARFPRAEKLASYAGTTPRVHASGGKTRYGPLRSDVNRYLKWAFIEAANVDLPHAPALIPAPRQPSLRAHRAPQGPPEGVRRRGPASRRGDLLDAQRQEPYREPGLRRFVDEA